MKNDIRNRREKNDKYCVHVSVKSPLIGGHEVVEEFVSNKKSRPECIETNELLTIDEFMFDAEDIGCHFRMSQQSPFLSSVVHSKCHFMTESAFYDTIYSFWQQRCSEMLGNGKMHKGPNKNVHSMQVNANDDGVFVTEIYKKKNREW